MIEQIFLGNSAYSLFLYVLRFPEKIENTLYLLGPSCTFAQVPHCLPLWGSPDAKIMAANRAYVQQQAFLLLRGRKVPCYGNPNLSFAPFFAKNFSFYPFTDGLIDKILFDRYLLTPNFPKIYAVQYKGGTDLWHSKIEYLNIPHLWLKLSSAQKEKVLNVFDIPPELSTIFAAKKQLLLTQPLSEDNICTEEEKREIYRRILQNYHSENIILKAHPREITDWKSAFPNITVIPKHIPSEMLTFLTPNLERIITFFSTAAFTMLKENQIDFYAKDFSKLKYFVPHSRQEGNRTFVPVAAFDIEKTYLDKNKFNWLKIPDPDGRFYR